MDPFILCVFSWTAPKASQGLGLHCLMPREILRLSSSISRIMTSVSSPTDTTLDGCTFLLVQSISDTCTKPSTPDSISAKQPYSVRLVIVACTFAPSGYRDMISDHGSSPSCFIPRLTRFFSLSNFRTRTSTSSPTLTISLGCLILFQAISVICKSPSTPPKSTKAP